MKRMCLFVAATLIVATAPQAVAQDTHEILVTDMSFIPQHIAAQAGDTIRWVWVQGIHTASSGSGCAPDFWFHAPIDDWNPVFEWIVPPDEVQPGQVIDYICLPHCGMGMNGTITVKDADVLGDLNGDGVVDVSDLLILLGAWGPCTKGDDCPADLNADGTVDVSDLLILLSNWG